MPEPSTYRSWNRPATEDELASERRRERRASWVRPGSIVVVLALVALDVVVVVVASGIQSAVRVRSGRVCATFWTDLAHDTTDGIWILAALVVVTLLLSVWRRWVFVAVLVTQIGLVAVLLPNLLHKRAEYLDVAAGRISSVQVDTGGVACS